MACTHRGEVQLTVQEQRRDSAVIPRSWVSPFNTLPKNDFSVVYRFAVLPSFASLAIFFHEGGRDAKDGEGKTTGS